MQLTVQHTIRCFYTEAVQEGHYELRLQPLSDGRQTCSWFELQLEPHVPIFEDEQQEGKVHRFRILFSHASVHVQTFAGVINSSDDPLLKLPLGEEDWGFYAQEKVRRLYREYLVATPLVPLVDELDTIVRLAQDRAEARSAAAFLISLVGLLHRARERALVRGLEAVTPPSSTDFKRSISQKLIHLMVAICRRCHIPARCVSGYLVSEKETSGKATMQENSHIHIDGMHLWVECLLPNEEWYGFDIINDLVVNDHYVKVHHGRDYRDVMPFKGLYRGLAEKRIETEVWVRKETGS